MWENEVNEFFSLHLDKWLIVNLEGKFDLDVERGKATTLFAVTMWLLWKHRNQVVFKQSFGTLDELLRKANSFADHIMQANAGKNQLNRTQSGHVRWYPPEPSWVKVNMDGASNSADNKAVVGGLARDYKGSWLSGF